MNSGTTTDDLWTPYKELVAVVEGYLAHESGGAPYAVHTFESVLRRHKQTFLSLLKNPVRCFGLITATIPNQHFISVS